MFGMYEFEKSCLKRFFQLLLCQMYHSGYRNQNTIQKYTLQERVSSDM